jgi:hypothetical protein
MPRKDRMRSAPERIGESSRRKLEALRDDCRRHPERPVPLECIEGPHEGASALELARKAGMLHPIAASSGRLERSPGDSVRAYLGMAKGDAEARALALLERLGELAIREPALMATASAEAPAIPAGKPGALLVGAVLISGLVAPDESSVLAPASAGTARRRAGGKARTITLATRGTRRVWQVPCVLSAIAQVCDAVLGASEVTARAGAFLSPCDKAASLLLELHALLPEDRLKAAVIAKRLKVQERRVRELIRELVDRGWPIESKSGRHGGARLIPERLSVEQRDWLERAAP